MDEDKPVNTAAPAVTTEPTGTPVAGVDTAPAPTAVVAAPKKGPGKLIAWIVAAVVVLGGGAYAAYALLGGGEDAAPEQAVVAYVAKLPALQSGVIDYSITMVDPATADEPMTLSGQALMNQEAAEITATLNILPLDIDLRLFDEAMYAQISGITSALAAFPEMAVYAESFAFLDGAWLGMNFSDLASMGMTTESVSNLPSISDSEMTALMDLLAEHPPFNVVESTDSKQVGDLTLTKKYDITFNAEEAKLFVAGVRDLNLASLADYDLDWDEAIASIDEIQVSMTEAGLNSIALAVWADADYIRHLELSVDSEDMNFEIVATVTSINEPVTIEVPTVDYSLSDLLTQMFGDIDMDSLLESGY